jgi:leucyl-tRNA synthetase
MVKEYGADALRCYELFIGDYVMDAAWNENGLKGCKKFLDRIYRLGTKLNDSNEYSKNLEVNINKTIKKVSEDLDNTKYNTAVSSLMILLNEYEKEDTISKKDLRILLHLLNPMAPHITEEMWVVNNLGGYVHEQEWPKFDPSKLIEDEVEVPVQVNGKLRGVVKVPNEAGQDEIMEVAKQDKVISEYLTGKEIVKVIFVKGRIFNVVVK